MSIDIVPIKAIPSFIPEPDRPTLQTVRRWVARGVRGRKLATKKRGGRVYVSLTDLVAFLNGHPSTENRREVANA